jgi:hypothetical protein
VGFALPFLFMAYEPQMLPCDGCGQLADPQHIALRLQRLEWATRHRPIHIQALLLSGIAPQSNDEYLYSPLGAFQAEARTILDAVQIAREGKSTETVLTEFQKLGLMLIHILECPLSANLSPSDARPLLENQLSSTLSRIRRSLKPKRVLLLTADLQPLADKLRQTDLGCPVHPAEGVFLRSATPNDMEFQALREALGVSYAQTVEP